MQTFDKLFYGFLTTVGIIFLSYVGYSMFYCDTVCETNRHNIEMDKKRIENQLMLDQMAAKQKLIQAQKEYEATPEYKEQQRIELEKHKATEARLAAEAEAREKTRIENQQAYAAKETADSVGYLETSRKVHDAIEVGSFIWSVFNN